MLITLVMVGLGAMHEPVPAADFVFQIPVRIENMRHMTSAIVSCAVMHDAPGLPNPISLGDPGTGSASVPVVGGVYNGTVTVTVSVAPDLLARYAPTGWSCGISYRWRNPDGTIFSASVAPGEREGIYTRLTGQAIGAATTRVSGSLPPP